MSNDTQTLLKCAVPTALAGVVAIVVGGVVAGGKGAIGAAVGTVIVIAFLGLGLLALERTAKSKPQLFQSMGLVLYTCQLLLLAVVLALFKRTTLFDLKVFAFSLIATTLVWLAAQGRAHMKSKIFYVDPESAQPTTAKKTEPANSSS
jgi:ATP synthase protein I